MEFKDFTLDHVLKNLKSWWLNKQIEVQANTPFTFVDEHEKTTTNGQLFRFEAFDNIFDCPELDNFTLKIWYGPNWSYVEFAVEDKEGNTVCYYLENDEFPKDFIKDFWCSDPDKFIELDNRFQLYFDYYPTED